MGIMVDHEIRILSSDLVEKEGDRRLISPFSEPVSGNGVISYGVTSAGYDLRLGNKVLIFKNTRNEIIDPKLMKQDAEYQSKVFDVIDDLQVGERVIIPPNSYILGYSLEYISVPTWLKGMCVGKSTYARVGIHINTTPLEPGWHGHLTIEIANQTPCPVAVYSGEGIAQVEFHMLHSTCEQTYDTKNGKYMAQGATPVPSKVK